MDATPCSAVTNQAELTRCWSSAASAAEGAADAQLKAAVVAIATAGPQPTALLHESQANWQRYRDSECALLAAPLAGGSAAQTASAVCRWRLARSRDAELRVVIEAWTAGR